MQNKLETLYSFSNNFILYEGKHEMFVLDIKILSKNYHSMGT